MPERTKRQHWLPRASYLHYFTQSGKLTVYRFKDGDKVNFLSSATSFKPTPENIGLEANLYETPALPDNTLEKAFGVIEAEYGRVLEGKILKKKSLSEEDRQILSLYVSLLEDRTPAQRAHWDGFLKQLEDLG